MNWWNELFFAYRYKFRKAKSCFYIYWVGMVKNEWGLIDHWALQWGVSHNWFDELSRLIEWFLHANSDGILFGLTDNLLSVFDI